ncbi:hypothetical protein LTR86_001238 [Recurvomyces mirabilis]|nr:hypothetical protein LTR86_001238 [Recurvomyces mirabilis]
MHLWSSLSRSARSSSSVTRLAQRWRPHTHVPRQRYISALAEHQQDDTETLSVPKNAKSSVSDSKDSAYLDFLLGGYGQPEDEPTVETRKAETPSKQTAGSRKSRTAVRSSPAHSKHSPEQAARARLKARKTARLARGSSTTISIRSELRTSAVFSSDWNTRYCKISASYDRILSISGQDVANSPELHFTPEASRRVERIVGQMDENPDETIRMKRFAQEYNKLERELWSETALWLLCYDKVKLMTFLRLTHTMLYPPINWIEDCYSVLAKSFDQGYQLRPARFGALSKASSSHEIANAESGGKEATRRNFRELAKIMLLLMDRETNEQFIFIGGWVKLLLPWVSNEQVLELWANIKFDKVKMHQYTYLHFSEHFAKSGQIERALEALLEAARLGGPRFVETVAFRYGCSTLLRRSANEPDGLRVTLRLVEHLAGLGLKLNSDLYTIIMLNAVDAGDLETMQNVYRAMQEQHILPTKFTYAVRLKACKLDVDNAGMLRDVIEEAIQFGDLRTNSIVCFEIMHCLALHHSKHNPDTAFATLSAAYDQFYDRAPLEQIGLPLSAPPPPARNLSSDSPKRMQPTRHILGIMLWTYLAHNSEAKEASTMYNRWREIIQSGAETDRALISCVETPHFSNIFLQHFMRSKHTLLQATRVVKDLQTPLSPSSATSTAALKSIQSPPNIHTWSIFLHGFSARGELKLAEQVLTYMRKRQMEPNVVTWTSLITAYARNQNEEGLVDVLRRSEQSGLVWNDWTRKGVGRFRDQERLREALRRQRLERELDFSGDLRAELEERLGGSWEGEGEGGKDGMPERVPDAFDRVGADGGVSDLPADVVDKSISG